MYIVSDITLHIGVSSAICAEVELKECFEELPVEQQQELWQLEVPRTG